MPYSIVERDIFAQQNHTNHRDFPEETHKPIKPDPDTPYQPVEPAEPDIQPDIIGDNTNAVYTDFSSALVI